MTKPLVAGLETLDSGDDKNGLRPIAIQRTLTRVVRVIQKIRLAVGNDRVLFADISYAFEYTLAVVFSSPMKGPEHAPQKHT